MLQQLAQHYGVRVVPVTDYCDALTAWVGALGEKVKRMDAGNEREDGTALRKAHECLSHPAVYMTIYKSACLGRMIYGGEKLRTTMCPEHKGQWQGISSDANGGCEHGCNLTGWLP